MTAATVTGLLHAAGLTVHQSVPWGTAPTHAGPGVYLMSLSPDPGATMGLPAAPLAIRAIETFLVDRPDLTWRGARPDAQTLADALATMWPPHQPVLCIGKAGTNTARRISRYYQAVQQTPPATTKGFPLHLLSTAFGLYLHIADAGDAARAKRAKDTMMAMFMAAVPEADRLGMCDPDMPVPFANLKLGPGQRKNHGLAGVQHVRS